MPTHDTSTFYVTTPIYYVNDRPHIGHVYTTVLADILARFERFAGREVFFLTGTDEHAAKVVDAAAERGLSPIEWADRNAAEFQNTFVKLGLTHDDFIRTTEDRHKSRVTEYISSLLETGDVYEGEYEGWYDAGQEEYIPENKAKEFDYKSPVNGRPLVRKAEKNYFFALSRYRDRLLRFMTVENPTFVQPDARRNEVVARIREGLNDVPMSRSGTGGWGIQMPNDPEQTVYVWIDALFNYLSTVDTDDRRHFWPANVHFIAKDILWFHTVIWPAMLMALGRELPGQVYTHSYWISEGQKMSKSLGNFIDLEKIDAYVEEFGLDALRWYLATQGPLGATDSDFAHHRFVDIYNTDLANTFGNSASRVANMITKYFDGVVPDPAGSSFDDAWPWPKLTAEAARDIIERIHRIDLANGFGRAIDLVRQVDAYIEATRPFSLAKSEDPADRRRLGSILYHCAEALRIASLFLHCVMPWKIEAFWRLFGQSIDPTRNRLGDLASWGLLAPGTRITKGEPLFPRYQNE